jgi:hypothetical protein
VTGGAVRSSRDQSPRVQPLQLLVKPLCQTREARRVIEVIA